MKFFDRFANNASPDSLASRMRLERSRLFWSWAKEFGSPLRILDVGGTYSWWSRNAVQPDYPYHITLYNIPGSGTPKDLPEHFSVREGDARDMSVFEDDAFDVVFSNSVIEHVGRLHEQIRMAREIQRVGKHYFVQTPNKFFPMEPHFLFPLWQFLPIPVRAGLLCATRVGWVRKQPTYFEARLKVEEIRLLTRSELQRIFPGCDLHVETVAGMAKSFTAFA